MTEHGELDFFDNLIDDVNISPNRAFSSSQTEIRYAKKEDLPTATTSGSEMWVRIGCKHHATHPELFDIIVDPDTEDFMEKALEFKNNVRDVVNIELGAGLFRILKTTAANGDAGTGSPYAGFVGVIRGVGMHLLGDNNHDRTVIEVTRPIAWSFREYSRLTIACNNYDGQASDNISPAISVSSRQIHFNSARFFEKVCFYTGDIVNAMTNGGSGTARGIWAFNTDQNNFRDCFFYIGLPDTPTTNTESYFYGRTIPNFKNAAAYIITTSRTNHDNTRVNVYNFKTESSTILFGYPAYGLGEFGLVISGSMTQAVRNNANAIMHFGLFNRSIANCWISGTFILTRIADTYNITGGNARKGGFRVQLSAGSKFVLPQGQYAGVDWVICKADRTSSYFNQWIEGYYLDCSAAVIDMSENPTQPANFILDNSSATVNGMVYRAVPQAGDFAGTITPFAALN